MTEQRLSEIKRLAESVAKAMQIKCNSEELNAEQKAPYQLVEVLCSMIYEMAAEITVNKKETS